MGMAAANMVAPDKVAQVQSQVLGFGKRVVVEAAKPYADHFGMSGQLPQAEPLFGGATQSNLPPSEQVLAQKQGPSKTEKQLENLQSLIDEADKKANALSQK